MKRFSGFTLAELLIALAVLGVIATFTIPKVLQAQTDSKYKAIAKEAAGAISEAYLRYQAVNGGVDPGMGAISLTNYINYVKIENGTIIDMRQTEGNYTCAANRCMRLHNGAILWAVGGTFNGTGQNNAVFFIVDPDGKETDSTTNGPGKSIEFVLYTTGKVRTWGTMEPATCDSGGCIYNPQPTLDPPWFSWN